MIVCTTNALREKHQQNSHLIKTYMSLDTAQLVKVYLNRLVHSLVPSEFGPEYVQSIAHDLVAYFTDQPGSHTKTDLTNVLAHCKASFLRANKIEEWHKLQRIVEETLKEKSLDQVAAYLVFLSEIQKPSHKFTDTAPSSSRLHPDILSSPVIIDNPGTSSNRQSQYAGIKKSPFQNIVDDSETILSLQHTLLGQDTNFLKFDSVSGSIDLPPDIDNGYAQLLSDVIEPGLIFRHLQASLERVRGKEGSPIKKSFYRSAESLLTNYVIFVNQMFENKISSLLWIYNNLQNEIETLRLLNFLNRQSERIGGYEFLNEVYILSKSGDTNVQRISQDIFNGIKAPYFEYLEQWVIQGDLIDENNEFFVSFNPEKTHIQDIVIYNLHRLPAFLSFEPSTFEKIFQIGKTLIFLDKYCNELDWLNDYASRYSTFIFGTHNGLKDMDPNRLRSLVECQYSEIMCYFTIIVQSKFRVFQHVSYLKDIMLMNKSDFIDSIFHSGYETLGTPAVNLTSGMLSEILIDSIKTSSVRSMPPQYRENIDARILDLSHGTIGWDVFTLEYKIPSLPAELLLNHNDERTQYLRLFNFLWGVRHFQFHLNHDFLEYQSLHKTNLRSIKDKCYKRHSFEGMKDRIDWFFKALRTINLIRNKLLMFINTILMHFSFDSIQDAFELEIVGSIFREDCLLGPDFITGKSKKERKLPILNDEFAVKCTDNGILIGLEKTKQWNHNGSERTIDELILIHRRYLQRISNYKLLDESSRGKFSQESYINQIYSFLNHAFTFIKSSQEFGATVINYVNVLNLIGSSSGEKFEEDLERLHTHLQSLMKMIHSELYMRKIRPSMHVFIKDLRADVDLKDLSKLL
ncbi:putative spindle pole body component [Clavispora lusitaniae]|uniref:Spindle pole body component n=1 Tax=Clavispora lusitaniae TaxID=36911 RepID=A0ACD0WM62_CLALS|nr:putative spindle pole body component [Clavispora lusitaniae]QFZ34094.1 putative spindle pole body component [Clavispora lusitaniae]QFZ39778.1 putative spindle pole body component [Clavispora lusitaniae]QFZ45460.1 putative spindle pole body component [Clavispora lusitaniae]QFZ51124.1 putative spindle pole body component [Clavispora lusitaniae]